AQFAGDRPGVRGSREGAAQAGPADGVAARALYLRSKENRTSVVALRGEPVVNRAVRQIWSIPGTMLIAAVRVYQWTLSPLIGRHCRFDPTCSEYFIGAVQNYGAVRGTWRGLRQIG